MPVPTARSRLLPAVFCLYIALAVLHTWPLATAPATLSRNDNADTLLNTWAIAWVAHALTTAPASVLDGNIFYPDRYTLTFSEPLILPGALSIPVRASGASAVLTYNLSLLLGLALSAWAMQWVVWRWTGDLTVSLLAGAIFGFNAHVLTRLGHLQALHAYGLPLLAYGVDRVLAPDGRRLRDGLLVGLGGAALALTSGYLSVFGVVCGLVVTAVRAKDFTRGSATAVLRAAGVAALVGLVLVGPVVAGYLAMRRQHAFERSLDSVAAMSANVGSYLYTPGRLHQATWAADTAARLHPRDALFPGVVAVALGLIGAWRGRGPARGIGVGLVVAGVVLSFGPATPVYEVFYRVVPFATGVRAASRFGVLAIMGVALLAALGLRALSERFPTRARMLAVLAIALVTIETFRGPVPYVEARPISPVYDTLARLPRGPVAEMPFWWAPLDIPRNAQYMLASTVHWQPLLNGYSGFSPGSYRRRADTLWYFPFRPAAFDELQRVGVRYVVLHLEEFGSQKDETLALIAASGRLRLIERVGETLLYEVIR